MQHPNLRNYTGNSINTIPLPHLKKWLTSQHIPTNLFIINIELFTKHF
ncbi:hypothetical protein NTGHW29_20071 [Candidatus Nitrotoga sp. HW29]|nr:hypothetical protein NTGHW29_20071 [Candidatus Nitrotoga sp. HW29]